MILQVWNFIKSTPSLQKLVSQAWHGESWARWLLLSFLICHLWFNPHQTVLVSWPRGSTKCNWCEGSVTPSRCASRTGDLPTFQIWRTRFLEVAQPVVQPHLSCTDSSWSSVWGPQACGTELSRSCGLQPTQAAILAADPRPATADSCIHLEIPLTHEIHHFLAGQIPLQVALCVAACAGGSKEQLEPSPKRAPSPPRGKFMWFRGGFVGLNGDFLERN